MLDYSLPKEVTLPDGGLKGTVIDCGGAMNNCALLSLSYALTGSSDLALLLRYCCAAAIPTILPILLDVDASGLAPNQALADALYEFSCTTAISIMADTVTPSKMMEHPTILCFTELTGILSSARKFL